MHEPPVEFPLDFGAQARRASGEADAAVRVVSIYVSGGHNFFGHQDRPAGTHPASAVTSVECVAGRGLRGDRFFDYKRDYPGQVTFFTEEVHERLLAELRVSPRSHAVYRRNVVLKNADLTAWEGREFSIQGVRFMGIGEAKPCHWMNEAVGPGAEAWLRGRGGLRAKILTDGVLKVDFPTAAGLLLAGGRSLRMGQDKAALPWKGTTLGEHQAATLSRSGAWPLLLSCRREQSWSPAGFCRIEDRASDGGVLMAFVEAFTATPAEVVIALAIDLPRVGHGLLQEMAGLARERRISVVPCHGTAVQFEPLAAAWHRSALPELRAAVAGNASFQSVCAALAARGQLVARTLSAADAETLVNLNSPTDLERAT